MRSPAETLARNGFDALFHGHPDGVAVVDLTGAFVDCNEGLATLTGYRRSELVTMSFGAILHADYQHETRQHFARAAAGQTTRYVTKGVTKSGDDFDVDVTNIPLRDDDGSVVAVLGIARDIGALRNAIEEVDRNQSIMRLAGRIARVAGWSFEVATKRLSWSEGIFDILGLAHGDVPLNETVLAMLPEPDRDIVVAAFTRCVRDGEPIDITFGVRDAHGDRLEVRILGEAGRDTTGAIAHIDGTFHDISDLVATRRERQALAQTLRNTLDQLGDTICFIDRSWTFTFVNKEAVRISGLSESQLLGRTVWDLYPAHSANAFGMICRRAMDEGVSSSAREYLAQLGRWLEVTAYPTDEGIAIILRDVTSDQESRQTIGEYTDRLASQAALLDAARDAILVRGLDHGIQYWNRAAELLYGWTFSEVEGRSVRDVLYDDPVAFDAATAVLMRTGYFTGELEQKTRDGRILIADCRWQLVVDSAGEPTAVFAVNSDVTEYKREQEQRVRTQRVESLGTLAGGIAHDLNNVLAPIILGVQLLSRGERDESRTQLLNSIELAALRGADMVRQVLSFARGVDGERKPVPIGPLLDELTAICRETLPKSITLQVERSDDLGAVLGDSTQLLQVLVNLVTNARDAMERGGQLTIRAHNVGRVGEAGRVGGAALEGGAEHEGGALAIELEDTGDGMPPEIVAKIFEPFFTTKELGRGTGLGLPTSLAIVASHEGQMDVRSEPGRGTVVEVRLPLFATEAAPVAPQAEPAPIEEGRGERVLVVDDEPGVRAAVRRTLEHYGYVAEDARDGREAVERIDSAEDPFDLVITDLMMPDRDGEEVLAHVAARHPRIAVVVASGLVQKPRAAREIAAGRIRYLSKPFSAEQLASTVRLALDSMDRRPR